VRRPFLQTREPPHHGAGTHCPIDADARLPKPNRGVVTILRLTEQKENKNPLTSGQAPYHKVKSRSGGKSATVAADNRSAAALN
jgi:hypothetical protein